MVNFARVSRVLALVSPLVMAACLPAQAGSAFSGTASALMGQQGTLAQEVQYYSPDGGRSARQRDYYNSQGYIYIDPAQPRYRRHGYGYPAARGYDAPVYGEPRQRRYKRRPMRDPAGGGLMH